MIYVGIDIAKLNHFAAAISSEGEILIEPFKFTNGYDGFYLLLSKLAPLDQHSIIIGLESTAHYGDSPVRFLSCFINHQILLYGMRPVPGNLHSTLPESNIS